MNMFLLKKINRATVILFLSVAFLGCNNSKSTTSVKEKIKVLIIDGQNNHDVWPKSTIMMKQYLEETGMFTVDVARSNFIWKSKREAAFLPLAGVGEKEAVDKAKTDPNFKPDFEKYAVVVSNFGWRAANWPKETELAFEKYIQNGGGFVSVHAADNCFPAWEEYNKMTGLGGWDRSEKHGPYVYYTENGKRVIDNSPGKCGSHGQKVEFPLTLREPHPITKGMPKVWLTSKDECYAKLRGPAENMTILATGKDPSVKSDRNEPILMVLDYGKGHVFHTTLGHDDYSFEGVGFITTFKRGVEWVATGKVTLPIPNDFPTEEKAMGRKFELK